MATRLLSPPSLGVYCAWNARGRSRGRSRAAKSGETGPGACRRRRDWVPLRSRTLKDGRSKRPLSPDPSPPAHATTPPRNQISYQSGTPCERYHVMGTARLASMMQEGLQAQLAMPRGVFVQWSQAHGIQTGCGGDEEGAFKPRFGGTRFTDGGDCGAAFGGVVS